VTKSLSFTTMHPVNNVFLKFLSYYNVFGLTILIYNLAISLTDYFINHYSYMYRL